MIQAYKMPLIISLIFILMGLIFKIFPPKYINPIFGYRTPRSMKSKTHWNFAQLSASKRSFLFGALLFLFSLSRMICNTISIKIQVAAVLITLFFFFILVELDLKNKFK